MSSYDSLMASCVQIGALIASTVYGMLDAYCWSFDRQDNRRYRLTSTALAGSNGTQCNVMTSWTCRVTTLIMSCCVHIQSAVCSTNDKDTDDASTTKAIHYSDWRVQHLLTSNTDHVTWWTLEHVELQHTHVIMCADCVRRVRSAACGMLDASLLAASADRTIHCSEWYLQPEYCTLHTSISVAGRAYTSSTHTIVTQS